MCTYITEANEVVRTAKRNKTIYKILKVAGGRACLSPYRGMFYSPNTIYRAEMDVHIFDHTTHSQVYSGFHAFRTLKSARDRRGWIAQGNNVIVKMTIPKGTHYYIGLFTMIVSDAVQTGTMDIID